MKTTLTGCHIETRKYGRRNIVSHYVCIGSVVVGGVQSGRKADAEKLAVRVSNLISLWRKAAR